MPTLEIDGRSIDVPAGTSVIEAARRLGIFIPHYCYHPALSVVGSCRMCLVKVEKAPKLQIACYTPVMDGMVVSTTDNEVTVARQGILEFLLAHHPLDCPVCDQAGECKLQEFYMQFGRYDSTLLEDKQKKHKAMPVGPNIILDSERCILCSRCTRFVDEVTGTHELGIFERGIHTELLPVEGVSVDNAYSGCLADICPVGALTDRDFRFKVRVWYLDQTESVCHGCARGCNIEIDVNRRRAHHNKGRLIARFRPRHNSAVNGYWMCDAGRYSYQRIESENRLLRPMLRSGENHVVSDWSNVLSALDSHFSGLRDRGEAPGTISDVAVIATPSLSNEELWATRILFADGLKIANISHQCPPDPNGVEDDLLRRADTFANTFGAGHILDHPPGTPTGLVADILDRATQGTLKTLVVIGDGLIERFPETAWQDALSAVDFVVAIQSHRSPITDRADVALPMSTYAESEGSLCNFEGHVQHYDAAIPPVGESRPLLDILADWAQRMELSAPPREPGACFIELASHVAYFAKLTYDSIGELGINPFRQTEDTAAVISP